MNVHIIVVSGPARSGKTHELVGRYVDALVAARAGNFEGRLWLAPSSRAAAAVRDQIIDRGIGACLDPGVLTFDELSKQIVAGARLKTRPISAAGERELLRRAIAAGRAAGALKFFGEAAEREGFVDSLAAHFRELKRRDIRPEDYQRIAETRGQAAQHRELARLYADYEAVRTAHGLVDGEGLYWAARELLAGGGCSRFSQLALIVVDGFTDFTRTQLEILSLLAQRAKRLFISLPADEPRATGSASAVTATKEEHWQSQWHPGERGDLFAKSTATLRELRARFPKLEVRRVASRPGGVAALDFLTQNVFRHPQPPPPADVLESLDRIEIVEAAGAQDEIVQLARRVKARLAAGDRPGDILVVFRSLADPQRVEDVFERYGIPYMIEAAPRIAGSPVFRTLASLVELQADDWPFRRLVSVITNNSLTALSDESRLAADWLVRDLQIAKGRKRLLDLVTGLAAQHDSADQFSDHYRRRITAAVSARLALSQLATALDRLPKEATANEWTAALERLGAELGMSPFTGWHALRLGEGRGGPQEVAPRPSRTQGVPPGDGVPPDDDRVDVAAWKAIVTHMAALEHLDEWVGEPPQKLDRREALAMLIDIATKDALPRKFDEAGRVRILAAATARSVAARHLYLAGMSEQAFPAAAGAGKLASDAEYGFFARAAHQAEPSGVGSQESGGEEATHSQEEMLLFYEVLSRAEETLTISYPAMDDKAQELPPSPYVIELKRMFAAGEMQIRCAKPQLSPVPNVAAVLRNAEVRVSEKLAYSVGDWRLQAVAEAIGPNRDARLLAGIFSHDETKAVGQAIDAGVRIVHARARGEDFGTTEGLLRSPAAVVALTKRFGPKHSWSPSQFETYAACPYKFFLQNVLKLEPLGDLVLETDFARRGSLFHEVLAAFHRKYRDSPADEWAALWADDARFADELRSVLEATVGVPREGIDGALVELDRRQIKKWTDFYRGQHAKYDKPWEQIDEPPHPEHFELRFGKKHSGEGGAEDPNSLDVAFALEIGGESIQISGRIDRIDVGRAGGKTVFNVIDYKSGKRPTLSHDKIESGERLQPALYAMAAEALLFGAGQAVPLWAGYWSMQQGVTTREQFSLHCSDATGNATEAWKTLRPKVVERIGQIVRGARRGDFPVDSKDAQCTRTCDFRTVCRVAQVRSVGKVWIPEDA